MFDVDWRYNWCSKLRQDCFKVKREVNLNRLLPLTLMIIALSVSWHIGYLQSSTIDTGTLVYRRMAGTEEQLVGLTPFTRHVFSANDPQCLTISRTGMFIVTSTPEGTDLIVRRFSTGEVIRQFSSQSNWAICSFRWLDDTTVRIPLYSAQPGAQEYVDLNVLTGSVSPYVYPAYTPPTYSQLPGRIESQPFFAAPNGSLFLYERCLGTRTATTGDGEVLCVEEKDWVVYNADNQEVVAAITTPGHVYVAYAPYESRSYARPMGIEWSPDSRFLASVTRFWDKQFPLQLVDTVTGQVSDLAYWTVDVDVFELDMYWSPDSRKLAFWVKADVNNIESDSTNKTLVIYDTLTDTFVHAAQTINPYNASQNGQWAPDGSAFAYMDANANLVHVDAATGATNILDSNIVYIELWAP
jgi:hypothetical protein